MSEQSTKYWVFWGVLLFYIAIANEVVLPVMRREGGLFIFLIGVPSLAAVAAYATMRIGFALKRDHLPDWFTFPVTIGSGIGIAYELFQLLIYIVKHL